MPKKKKETTKKTKVVRKRKSIQEISDIESLHKLIHRVQLNATDLKFEITDLTLSPVFENIIKDAKLDFEKKENHKKIIYTILHSDIEFGKEEEEADAFFADDDEAEYINE